MADDEHDKKDGGEAHKCKAARFADIGAEDGEVRGPLYGLFFSDLKVSTLEEALAPLVEILPGFAWGSTNVKLALKKSKKVQKQYSFMTLDEIPSIVLYTMEAVPREDSLYFALNKALRDKDRSAVKPWRDYIWLFLHSLKKLPASNILNVVRGAKLAPEAMNLNLSHGDEFSWAGFSSVTTTVEVMANFLGTEGTRTCLQLQMIEKIARDVRDFSFYPSENELLLPPNLCFEFVSKYDAGNGLTIVQAAQNETVDPILDLSEKLDGDIAGSGAKAAKILKEDAQEVRLFLKIAGLSTYADKFIDEGYDTLEILADVTDDCLIELGLKGGHKLKFFKELKNHQAEKQEVTSGKPSTDKGFTEGPKSSSSEASKEDSRFKLIAKADKNKGNFPNESLRTLVNDVDDAESGTHIIVGNLNSKDYLQFGEYIFKLVFKSASNTVQMEWAQTSWLTSSSPMGFRPIAISDTRGAANWNKFTGLRSGEGPACLTSTHGWYAAVGQTGLHNGGIPALPGNPEFIADTAELFIDCLKVSPSHAVTKVDSKFKLIAKADKNKGNFPKESLRTLVNDVDNAESGKHIIVGNLNSKDYLQDGEHIFKLVFKSEFRTVQMEWAQTSWLTSSSPMGFRPIAMSDTQGEAKWFQFTGLRSGEGPACLTSTHGWYAAVGQTGLHNGGIPALPGHPEFIADTAELFIHCPRC